MFTPAVITSRKAQDDLDKIRGHHEQIVTGIADQNMRVQNMNMQKEAQVQADNSMKVELEKERMVADTAQKKDALNFAQKQAEIDVKRAALAAS